MVDVIYNEHT